MQICLGILYSWSVFRGPLAKLHGWPLTVTIAPYRWSILFFTIAMVIAGFWQDKKGPKLVGTVGGILLGTGCLLASFFGGTPTGLILSYGVVGGLGVGFAYVTPIATCVKWFPDRRGFVVGLAVMGFGVGSLIFAPLLEVLIGKDPAQFATTIPRTFLILAVIFYVLVTGCAQVYRVPPKAWKPEGWNPPAGAAVRSRTDYKPGEMVRTWQFYAAWLVYFLGSAVGLTVIGEAAPLINTNAGANPILTGAGALGLMSLFNGVGRLVWGTLSDKSGRRTVLVAMALISMLTCAFVLPGANTFLPVLAGICLVGFCYGGYLAVMPTLTADYYGPGNVGANYGIMFSAWGAAGFLVPGYLSAIVEKGRQAGNLAAGYNEVFYILAGLAVANGMIAVAARRPE